MNKAGQVLALKNSRREDDEREMNAPGKPFSAGDCRGHTGKSHCEWAPERESVFSAGRLGRVASCRWKPSMAGREHIPGRQHPWTEAGRQEDGETHGNHRVRWSL